jgi:hypothetical protein
MHPGVAVAIGHVEVSRRGWDYLRRIVKGTSGAGDDVTGTLTPGVRVLAALAQHLERFAVQGVGEAHRILPVCQIHHIVGNVDAMRVCKRTDAPAAEVRAIPVKDDYWRVFTLKHINLALGIGGDSTDITKRLARRQLGSVLDQPIGIFARPYSCHIFLPSSCCVRVFSTPANAAQA